MITTPRFALAAHRVIGMIPSVGNGAAGEAGEQAHACRAFRYEVPRRVTNGGSRSVAHDLWLAGLTLKRACEYKIPRRAGPGRAWRGSRNARPAASPPGRCSRVRRSAHAASRGCWRDRRHQRFDDAAAGDRGGDELGGDDGRTRIVRPAPQLGGDMAVHVAAEHDGVAAGRGDGIEQALAGERVAVPAVARCAAPGPAPPRRPDSPGCPGRAASRPACSAPGPRPASVPAPRRIRCAPGRRVRAVGRDRTAAGRALCRRRRARCGTGGRPASTARPAAPAVAVVDAHGRAVRRHRRRHRQVLEPGLISRGARRRKAAVSSPLGLASPA